MSLETAESAPPPPLVKKPAAPPRAAIARAPSPAFALLTAARGRAAALLLGGAMAGIAVGLADSIVVAIRSRPSEVFSSSFAPIPVSLAALACLPFLGVGAVLALCARLTLSIPFARSLVDRYGSVRAWAKRDPVAFGSVLGVGAGAGTFGIAITLAHIHFSTAYHRADFAAYAMGAASLVLATLAILLGLFVREIGTKVAPWLGPFGVPLAPVLALFIVGAAVLARFLVANPVVLSAYPPLQVGFVAFVILSIPLSTKIVRSLSRRRASRPGGPFLIAATGVVLSAALLFVGAYVYRGSNRARAIAPSRGIFAPALVRVYSRLTDRDRDGFSWAFGNDCDDSRDDVYPGAHDARGDGVDADCFAGDGSPSVVDLGQGAYAQRPATLTRPNVLVVTIDALRPDHLGAYGYSRATSPRIDAFARTGTRFDQAIAQSSRSLRSIPALWTGLYPAQIAFGDEYLWPSLELENETVADRLKERGYQTAAVIGTHYFRRLAGFYQGFDFVYEDPEYQPPPDRVAALAIQKLGEMRTDAPWLMWLHLFNVHEPPVNGARERPFGPTRLDAYDAEVKLADELFGRVLDAVDQREDASRTVIVLASDHGELLGEHGKFGHCTTLYEPELRSTLIVRAPGVRSSVVAAPVALMDIAPTLLNLADVPVRAPMAARSLLGLMTGETQPDPGRMIFSELVPDGLWTQDFKSVHVGGLKLIWTPESDAYEMFDLNADPHEQLDIADQRPADLERLSGLVRSWAAEASLPSNQRESAVRQNRFTTRPSVATPLDADVEGLFRIIGFEMRDRAVRPTESVPLALFFEVKEETDRDFFFRITFDPRVPHLNGDHFPIYARYRTYSWREGEFIRDPVPIVIPPELVGPREFTLSLQVYEDNELVPMRVAGQEVQSVSLGTLRIIGNRPFPLPRPPVPAMRIGGPDAAVPVVR